MQGQRIRFNEQTLPRINQILTYGLKRSVTFSVALVVRFYTKQTESLINEFLFVHLRFRSNHKNITFPINFW